MSARLKFIGLVVAAALCLPAVGRADTHTTSHRVHKAKKQQPPPLPPPLPSGPQGPVPQVPLDAISPVAPQVIYKDGQLTIVAANSTLGDILRGVRKHTSADIEIPPTASERVVTRLGPGPAREVMAELLNGSHFNYILLGSPDDANLLVRVVLVPKSSDAAPEPKAGEKAAATPPPAIADAPDAPDADATADDAAEDDSSDQTPAVEAEQATPADPQVKTPQQMLQEMQQRQLQMQQQPGQPGFYPPGRPGGAILPPGQPAPQPEQQ